MVGCNVPFMLASFCLLEKSIGRKHTDALRKWASGHYLSPLPSNPQLKVLLRWKEWPGFCCMGLVSSLTSLLIHTCPWEACDERVSHRNARERSFSCSSGHVCSCVDPKITGATFLHKTQQTFFFNMKGVWMSNSLQAHAHCPEW